METRIVLPAAIAAVMVLGAAMSTIIPTRMVEAAAAPWADSGVVKHPEYKTGATYQFVQAAPEDLDPSFTVGPVDQVGDGVSGSSGTIEAMESEPVFVPVEYGLSDKPETQPDPAMTEPEQVERYEPFVATIY